MSSRPNPLLLISHSSADLDVVTPFIDMICAALPLPAHKIICSTVDGSRFASGKPIDVAVVEAIQHADAFIAVLSHNSVRSRSNWVLFEIGARWAGEESSKKPLRFLELPGFSRESLGEPFIGRVMASAQNESDLHHLIETVNDDLGFASRVSAHGYQRLLDRFSAAVRKFQTIEESKTGAVSRAGLLESPKLPGEVYAIEILERPIRIKGIADGGAEVTVDRRGVCEVVISNAGKMAKVKTYVTAANHEEVRQLDANVQEYLAHPTSRRSGAPELPEHLRWASGGVLSIVKRNGTSWVPFFFRDIRPYGWNISLGNTERHFGNGDVSNNQRLEEELKEPFRYIAREFIEESIVLSDDPAAKSSSRLRLKRFSLRNPGAALYYGGSHDEEHLRHRRERDHLHIDLSREAHDLKPVHEVTDLRLLSQLHVISENGVTETTDDVLVCFSLLDLGVEVVKVFRYDMEPPESMLDGEIIETPAGREIVRMPVALMSVSYLERVFQRIDQYDYTEGPQPSIEVPATAAPAKDEIELFTYDVNRRMEILRSGGGSEFEQKRYLDWYDAFHENFLDSRGNISRANPSRLFVPGTAKILNLYFNSI